MKKSLISRKLKRNIRLYVRGLEKDGGVFGFEADDIIIGRSTVIARGEYGSGDSSDLVANFNRRGQIDKISLWVDYKRINRTALQDWEFSNFKKFEKAVAGKYETIYAQASLFIDAGVGDDILMKRGMRMIKGIPGIDDFDMTLLSIDTYY